jgi:hypothetical protein
MLTQWNRVFPAAAAEELSEAGADFFNFICVASYI